jgi:hypothetical protein
MTEGVEPLIKEKTIPGVSAPSVPLSASVVTRSLVQSTLTSVRAEHAARGDHPLPMVAVAPSTMRN